MPATPLIVSMRLRNASSKRISVDLWRSLVAAMGLEGVLPCAQGDELILYPADRQLRIVVRPLVSHPGGQAVESGCYTFGVITLRPCRHCTPGLLTHLLLHELFHAWLHQFHPGLYSRLEHCPLAEAFADASFEILGGLILPRRLCGSYHLKVGTARRNLERFARFAARVTRSSSKEVEAWARRVRRKPSAGSAFLRTLFA